MVTTGQDQGPLTVTDFCTNRNLDDGSHHTNEMYVDDDDDSFLANNSICKLHKKTIRMLDSLTNEVVEMARGNNATTTTTTTALDKNSRKQINMIINLNNSTRLSSPLSSPRYIQDILSIAKEANTNAPRPLNSSSKSIFNKSRDSCGQYNDDDDDDINDDDDDDDDDDDNSTMCSIDNSIHNELNALKEVATELEKELGEENLNTVFEAIERIGNSGNQNVKNALDSEKKDIIRECIRDEIRKNKEKKFLILRYCRLGITSIIRTFQVNTKSIIILIVSIILGLVLNYIFASRAI